MWYENYYDNHNFFNIAIYLFKLFFLHLLNLSIFQSLTDYYVRQLYISKINHHVTKRIQNEIKILERESRR